MATKRKPRQDAVSAARAAADKLTEIILSRPEGTYLGSQDDLLELLGIGRVTLQQTARLLEHERLIEVRRGVNGGYFGARPTIDMVERAVMVYLRSRGTEFPDTLGMGAALEGELLRLAGQSHDEADRERLRQCRTAFEVAAFDMNEKIHLLDSQFYESLFALANDPFCELMHRVIARLFSLRPVEPSMPDVAWRRLYRDHRLRMIDAVLLHDSEYGFILSRRFSEFLVDSVAKARWPST